MSYKFVTEEFTLIKLFQGNFWPCVCHLFPALKRNLGDLKLTDDRDVQYL